uniref:Putative RNA-directed DNA polymerase, eukaryota, reverse transcriptase zinc-binding domain protein n=1 Tax=Tanacetum cinerariifolium TaxID=118510 RepID=A0A699H8M1_TANCI|nr:putative RNA-directed DNA polymerase, eukaryota, reverse transcriptase zinc-binding domain protein [Tanacetum cinerariifolium]
MEDDVSKISTSIFITNFLVSFSTKELFNSCKQYGHVVDAFIPTKRSKAGKRIGLSGVGNSYVHVVKGKTPSVNTKSDPTLALVLDDECLNSTDLSNSLLGRVKEFTSLSNLKMVMNNEGFNNFKIQSWFSQLIQASIDFIIEGRIVWVEIEGIPFKTWSDNTFKCIASKWGELLHIDDQDDNCLYSKRLCINTKVGKNIMESFKIIFCGKVSWIRAKEVIGWVIEFLDESDDEHDSDDDFKEGDLKVADTGICGGESDVEEVLKTLFEEWSQNNNYLEEMSTGQKENHSEDPFNIYELLNKKNDIAEREKNSDHSLKYQPGYTPNEGTKSHCKNVEDSKNESGEFPQGCYEEEENNVLKDNSSKNGSKEDVAESVCLGHFKKSVTIRTCGSILNLMEELVKVGQTMDDCVNNMTEIIESQGKGEVIIMGDFNEVRYKSERFGSLFNVQDANVFISFIANAGLEEVPLGGSSFTWCHKSATKMSKLDRFLISLDRYLSDHRPILLRESHFDYGPTPFRFFHYWFEIECFNKLVEDLWIEAHVDGSNAMVNMMKKLKYLKQRIRKWNKGNMESSKNRKAKLKDDLKPVNAIIDKGEGNDEVVKKRMDVFKSIQDIDKLQSLEMAQKAKIKWSIEGDENSSFYHGVLNKKRSQLNIRGIMVEGTWNDSPQMVKSEFFQHFRRRFDKPYVSRDYLDMNYSKTLSIDQQVELELEVSKEEIKRAVWDCGTDKSPGPDRFTFGFYRRLWKIIKNDAFEAVKHFFTHGDIPKGCNSSFIALILKICDANVVKDFRPISLIGSLYKIIAKILANHLVVVLGDIVNEVQSAFIADQKILDSPFILNEVLQWCKSKKKQSLIFKVDFEKAYDLVRWDILDDVLKKFGFGDKWCKWIQCCLSSSRGSILINGSPMEEFQLHKDLNQGDPLSSLLFILVMESLHLSFQRVVDAGMFKGIMLSSSLNLSHMFYVDDAVFVGQWCDGNINTLVHVLECFFYASGLRINMSKSKLMGVLVDDDKVMRAASKLGCLILKSPFSYLGWSLFAAIFLMVMILREIHGKDRKMGRQVNYVFLSYWIDIVHELNVLKRQDLYPRMYALETCKSVKVGTKLAQSSLEFLFRRRPTGGVEQEQYEALSVQVHDVILVPLLDRWKWSLESSRDFSVALVRNMIDDKMLPDVTTKTRWIKSVPIKVNVHAWKIKIDSLPTRLNISRRGMDIDSITCPICDSGVESSSHIFFTCSIVSDIIRKITRWWDVAYTEVDSYEDWLNWLVNLRLASKHKQAKETMFLVLSRMAMDILSVQANLVASESAFSTKRKQDKSTLETLVDCEEEILDAEVQANEAIPLSEEIALDAASSEGSMSGPGSGGEEAEDEAEANYGYDVYLDDY